MTDSITRQPTEFNLPIAQSQQVALPGDMQASGLYLHVPFCFHKCHYCDFYSIVEDDVDRHLSFAHRLGDELEAWKRQLRPGNAVRTLFIGGGTPTYLSPKARDQVIQHLREQGWLADLREFTVEANPETVDAENLAAWVNAGLTRISIGAQSFQPSLLKALERWHDPASVPKAVDIARQAGITSVSLDLIYAIPGQDVQMLKDDLQQAIALEPDHLSVYSLTFEPRTALYQRMRQGQILPQAEDDAADLHDLVEQVLESAGYERYEISNWVRNSDKRDHRCQHNLLYWQTENWLAAGPSAAGHVDGLRWTNTRHLGKYLDSTGIAPMEECEQTNASSRISDFLMMGLRVMEGIPMHTLHQQLSEQDPRQGTITRLIDLGLLENKDRHLRLTHQGLRLADSVLVELM